VAKRKKQRGNENIFIFNTLTQRANLSKKKQGCEGGGQNRPLGLKNFNL